MRFTSATLAIVSLLGLVQAAPAALEERVLPSGHPPIDNAFLSANGLATGYTVKANIYPSGFAIPTEPLTALPSGYSVAYNGVFNPEGRTVSAFPSEAIAQVAALASSSAPAPGAPSDTASAAPAATPSTGGASTLAPSFLVGAVFAGLAAFMA
ncbi:hypothetical protein C8R43DRAFT_975606 [Mycena crocata]|nr:hypothetical protein C8R43DRAFT_975606 [Mycena crocata]